VLQAPAHSARCGTGRSRRSLTSAGLRCALSQWRAHRPPGAASNGGETWQNPARPASPLYASFSKARRPTLSACASRCGLDPGPQGFVRQAYPNPKHPCLATGTLEMGGSVRCTYLGYGCNRDRRRWHRLQTVSVKANTMQKLMRRMQNIMQNNAKNNARITRALRVENGIWSGLGPCIYGVTRIGSGTWKRTYLRRLTRDSLGAGLSL
jgi:hypothetical protein